MIPQVSCVCFTLFLYVAFLFSSVIFYLIAPLVKLAFLLLSISVVM